MRYLNGGAQNVLLATDFSDHGRRAFDAAIRAARLWGARLHILHVNEEEASFGGHGSAELTRFMEAIVRRRVEWMASFEAIAREQGVEAEAITRHGVASETILRVADTIDAGLIVMGTTGARVIHRWITGSTAKRVLRQAERPVLAISPNARVAPPEEGGTFSHIVYPTDLSPASHAGLELAERFIDWTGARLSLVNVLRVPTFIPSLPGEPPIVLPSGAAAGLEARLAGELAGVADRLKATDVRTFIEIHADTAEGIADVAEREEADLVLISRHGERSVGSFLFGRTAENLSKIAPAPVLLFTPLGG